MTPPASASAPPTATPELVPEPAPKKRTKYDDLVDVLADGLFEVIMTEPTGPRTTPRRRRGNHSSASMSPNASDQEPRPGAGSPSTYSD